METRPNEEFKTLELYFKRRLEDYVDQTTPSEFVLKFNNLKEFETQDHDPEYPKESLLQDGTTIDLFGFSSLDIPLDGVSPKTEPSENLSCLSLITVTGKAIRICADSAEIVVEN